MILSTLPDITELKGVAARSLKTFDEMDAMQNGRLSKSFAHPNKIPYNRDRYDELQREQSALISAAQPLAQRASDAVIAVIAEGYGLGGAYQSRNASVVVRDDYLVYCNTELAMMDWMAAPTDYIPKTSSFYPEGQQFFGHPKGPVIVLYLPQATHAVLAEEGVHYLQWFYESDGRRGDTVDIPRLSREQEFTQSLLYESVAEVTRELLGVNDEGVYCGAEPNIDAWIEVLGMVGTATLIDKREIATGTFGGVQDLFSPELLVHTLAAEGREAAYHLLLEDTGYPTLDAFLQSRPLQPTFPSNVVHYLGYELGKRIVHGLGDASRVREFAERVFSPSTDPNTRLDELLDFHRRSSAGRVVSPELLKRLRARA